MEQAKNKLKYYNKPILHEPKKPELDKTSLSEPAPPELFEDRYGNTSAYILLISSCLLLFFAFAAYGSSGFKFIFGGFILFLFMGISLIRFRKKKLEENEYKTREYERTLANYKKEYKEKTDEYRSKMVEYNKQQFALQTKYEEDLKTSEKNYAIAEKKITELNKPLKKTQEVLQQLYNLNILFPKYRNFVAVCTFYEYFLSGRVSELSGPNGAYNLYEAELRQNLIINNLDKIVSQLDQIQKNQYTIYQELNKANHELKDISREINQILSNTNVIKKSSYIMAYCSQITAKNAQALKYISMVS